MNRLFAKLILSIATLLVSALFMVSCSGGAEGNGEESVTPAIAEDSQSKQDIASAIQQQFPSKKPETAPNIKAEANSATTSSASTELSSQVITASPEALDMGEISTSEKVTGVVTLKNTSATPVTVLEAKASCGCTTADFKRNSVIGPGEELDVTIEMDGKGRARTIAKTVTFNIEGYPSLRLPVTAKTISYVTLDSDPISIVDGASTGELTLTAIDDAPFLITAMVPSIATELPTEPASSHTLTLDWDKFWEVVMTTKVTFRLNHPLCKEVTTNIRLTPDQRQRLNTIIRNKREGNDLPTKDPDRPLTGDQLARYIKAGQGAKVLKYIQDGLGAFDAVDRGGISLLSTASQEGDAETIQGLIDLGANVENTDRVNRTPLMYAARSKDLESIRTLLDAGADIQSRDTLGNTPLSWASGFGNAEGVTYLIDAGADVNTRDLVLGYTPLLWASGFGDAESIPVLLEAGADVGVRDNAEGRTPLMHAVRTGTLSGVQQLLDAQASISSLDNESMTALHIGAASNNVTLAKIDLLVKSGADVNAKDKEGMTPLDHARTRTDDAGLAIIDYLSPITQTE